MLPGRNDDQGRLPYIEHLSRYICSQKKSSAALSVEMLDDVHYVRLTRISRSILAKIRCLKAYRSSWLRVWPDWGANRRLHWVAARKHHRPPL